MRVEEKIDEMNKRIDAMYPLAMGLHYIEMI